MEVAQLVERLARGETKVELARLNKVGFDKDFLKNAEVAQLVERNLAKVEVAGSNLVFRSS